MKTKDLKLAAETLKKGGVVAFPTETVYGLGALAFLPEAVAKVYEIKQRPLSHPLIVHIADPSELKQLVTHIPEKAELLTKKFWPGALTVVLPKSTNVPEVVSGGLPSVGVRCPSHPIAQELIRLAGMPIAAPSANLFGNLSTTTAEHVTESLGSLVDCIIDGGPSQVGVESTIVSFLESTPQILRQGGISQEEIEEVIGPVALPSSNAKAIAPGMLEHHYSPHTKLSLQTDTHFSVSGKVGLLCLKKPENVSSFAIVEELSSTQNLREAASHLYEAMHRLDKSGLDSIVAFEFPDYGLGKAINDRLRRAAAERI